MPPSWLKLFVGDKLPSVNQRFNVISRQGHRFIWLPKQRKAALRALMLYPAQTIQARATIAVVRCLLFSSLRAFLPQLVCPLSYQTHFATFLRNLAQSCQLPTLAVLVGNPSTPGTRFIFLLFNDANTPVCVVKAGTTPLARELVQREFSFLQEYSRLFSALPSPLGYSDTDEYTALALPFIAGNSPRKDDGESMAQLLGSWISHDEPIALRSIPAWQNLPRIDETFRRIDCLLAGQMVQPVLMHGDFAPWNVKVAKDGSYAALDWERGGFPGVPSWDWFHYIVQTSILVRHDSPHQTMLRLQRLFTTPPFRSYAQQAGIADGLLGILAGYLLHNKMHGLSGDAESIDQISRLVMRELGN
jgi:hypothetical protein